MPEWAVRRKERKSAALASLLRQLITRRSNQRLFDCGPLPPFSDGADEVEGLSWYHTMGYKITTM